MKRIIWRGIFTATVLVASVMIYEDLTVDRPDTYGGGASYSTTLVVGSSPKQFGIERESYWTDQTGEVVVPYGDLRHIPPGYRHHISANVLVGKLSFPLPLRPWADGILAVVAMSAIGCFLAARRRRAASR